MQGNFAYLEGFPYLAPAIWDYSPVAYEDRSAYLGSASFSIMPYQLFAQYSFRDYRDGQVGLQQPLIDRNDGDWEEKPDANWENKKK